MEGITNITGDLNWYDLYRHKYPDGLGLKADSDERYGTAYVNGEEITYKRGYTYAEYTPWLKNHPSHRSNDVFGAYVTDYLNRNDTREALHIPSTLGKYEECSDLSGDNYHYLNEASMWIYKVMKR
jgi:hypothetical protein